MRHEMKLKKMWVPILILILCVVGSLALAGTPLGTTINLLTYDYLLRNTKTDLSEQNVVVVGIDDDSLKRFEAPLMLWYGHLAKVIEGIADGGARAIALDIIPAMSLESLAPELDRQLVSSLKKTRDRGIQVYLGFSAAKDGALPHKKFLFAASGAGFLNFFPDRDERVRCQPLKSSSEGDHHTVSLPVMAVDASLRLSSVLPGKLYIDYRLQAVPTISFGWVHGRAVDNDIEALNRRLEGKIVFIGVTSSILGDRFAIPTGFVRGYGDRVPGVLIHAYMAKTILARHPLRDMNPITVVVVSVLIALISGTFFVILPPRRAALVIIAMLITASFGIAVAFRSFLIIPPAPLLFAAVVSGGASLIYRSITEYREFRTLQRFFSSYVNPQVMRQIMDNPEMVSFEGSQTIATVMFTDIRGFTSLAEKMDPTTLLEGLNHYFGEMTRTVQKVDGYLNRYLGDGILAVFGAPNPLPYNGALAAVRSALMMQERLADLNSKGIFSEKAIEVRIGIGIHTGEMIVGNVGCYEKMDYSVIGDTVNVASRIEGLTKEFKKPILISEKTYEVVKDKVDARFVANVKVKGRQKEVGVFEVLSVREGQT
jgi:class 3 adenylate cyclase/CHASE2 domain-containing sensor protein